MLSLPRPRHVPLVLCANAPTCLHFPSPPPPPPPVAIVGCCWFSSSTIKVQTAFHSISVKLVASLKFFVHGITLHVVMMAVHGPLRRPLMVGQALEWGLLVYSRGEVRW